MQAMDSIGVTLGRTRLMRLSPHAKVTQHADKGYYWRERMRIHVPITTQPTVRFYCGDAMVNMAAGECWIFDTWRLHRVVNDDEHSRVHLVIDTVGGERFWNHVADGNVPDQPEPGWQPRFIAPDPAARPQLDFESTNSPVVMTPWEVREHIGFLLTEIARHPQAMPIQQSLLTFTRRWQALWACYGESREGWPRYRALLDQSRQHVIACGAGSVHIDNKLPLQVVLDAHVFEAALADGVSQQSEYVAPEIASPTASPSTTTQSARDEQFDRPVFIVCPPRSGSTFLFETLAQAPGVYTIGDESHQLIEGVAGLAPAKNGYASNCLAADDAWPSVVAQLRQRFLAALRDRDRRPPAGGPVRMLEKTPKNALRVPFLAAVFPEARFVYLHRDPRQVLSSMIEAWSSGRFRTYQELPDWQGPPWSLLLVPGWRRLNGLPLNQIVAAQWRTTTKMLLDELDALPPERVSIVNYDTLCREPEAEIRRLCEAVDFGWDRELDKDLPLSRYTVSKPDPDKWRRHEAEIEAIMASIQDQVDRAEAFSRR
jgi:hypothetical protein